MAVYYPSTVTCNRDGMQSLYQEPIYLNQQQASPSSAGSFSDIVSGGGGGGNCLEIPHAGVRNEMVFIPPTGDVAALQGLNANVTTNTISSSDLSFHGQGLSLSLGTQIPNAVSVPPFQYQYQNMSNQLGFGPNHSISVKETLSCNVDESGKSKEMLLGQSDHISPSGFNVFYNNYRYETSGFVSSVMRSRYLKPAQQLLDEVVNVKKDVNNVNKRNDNNKEQDFNGFSDSKDTEGGSANNGTASNVSESNMKPPELSPSERQELQNKKTKLLSMVDEVDKRYNQYYHQMEAMASSFEMVAGLGAAKPYTSVALNRISRHFRCLRDAIKGQIQIIRGKLGERESSDDQGERIPRLRYLDQRLRQQRALHQQLGMVRPAWRPQRGLPENAVSILRAWLFEHFLHPYPKESEKIMLAKQTGLTKNQVANWFINARVRLWKPMIEEMYKEEFGDSQLNSKSSLENNASTTRDSSHTTSQFKHEDSQSQQRHNNNLSYSSADTNSVFPEPKPDESQQMNRSADYDSLMNYQGFNLDEYRFVGLGNQQDNRFSNPHHLHDFVV